MANVNSMLDRHGLSGIRLRRKMIDQAAVAIPNKPDGIEGASCDWAIVYVPNRPFAIAVMTSWLGQDAQNLIAILCTYSETFCTLRPQTLRIIN